jgi:2-(3-amino-3-carboxypropyl)histidine synthase
MKRTNLADLEEYYDLELDKVVLQIKKEKAKIVLLQFPDGLKKYATTIVDFLEEKSSAQFLIYFGQCFGACDTPEGIDKSEIDLVIQFGHSELMPSY